MASSIASKQPQNQPQNQPAKCALMEIHANVKREAVQFVKIVENEVAPRGNFRVDYWQDGSACVSGDYDAVKDFHDRVTEEIKKHRKAEQSGAAYASPGVSAANSVGGGKQAGPKTNPTFGEMSPLPGVPVSEPEFNGQQSQDSAIPEIQATKRQEKARSGVTSNATNSSSTARPVFVDEFIFLYERELLKSKHSEPIEKQYKCTFSDTTKQAVPSVKRRLIELRCTPAIPDALALYCDELKSIRAQVATIVIPLPAIIHSIMGKTLSKKIRNELKSNTEVFTQMSFPDFHNNLLVHLCRNEDVERAEFMIKQLIRRQIFMSDSTAFRTLPAVGNSIAMFKMNSPQQNCRILVCAANMMNVSANVYVNSIDSGASFAAGLSEALNNATGSRLKYQFGTVRDELLQGNFIRASALFATGPRKELQYGDVLCTWGFNLPCEFVLHVVIPEDREFDDKQNFRNALVQSYLHVLRFAGSLYPTFISPIIAIPLLSGGKLRDKYSMDRCFDALAEAMEQAFSENLLSRFCKIYLVDLRSDVPQKVIEALSKKQQFSKVAFKSLKIMKDKKNPFEVKQPTEVYSTELLSRPFETYSRCYGSFLKIVKILPDGVVSDRPLQPNSGSRVPAVIKEAQL